MKKATALLAIVAAIIAVGTAVIVSQQAPKPPARASRPPVPTQVYQTVTSYSDSSHAYQCSRPIQVRSERVPAWTVGITGWDGWVDVQTPVNEAEAKRFCQPTLTY